MAPLAEKDNRAAAVEDIAVTNITFAETSGETVCTVISAPKDIIAIAALSVQDDGDHSKDKGTPQRQWSDEVAGMPKVNGGQASTGSSHRESSLSGTPPSAEGYRDEMMAQWLVNKPWPSGPSFDFDSLSEEAQQLRRIARLSALASVGTGFGMAGEREDNYPQHISIEEDMEASGEEPVKSSKDVC